MKDIPIPGPSRLNERCEIALGYAASVIEQECGTKNGCTALYWHLHGIAESHAGSREDEKQEASDG